MLFRFKSGLLVLSLVALGWAAPCLGQNVQRSPALDAEGSGVTLASEPASSQRTSGSVSGTIVDQSGAVVTGAKVKLTTNTGSSIQETTSGGDGQFSFANIAPGTFQLTVNVAGFAMQTVSGDLRSGQIETIPPIMLAVATDVTEVQVGLSQIEVAEEQVKVEEKQRILGAIPNFYVSYLPNPAPLTSKQKFEIAWKTVVDPVTLLMVGGAAGVEQAQNHFTGYGQGADGYAKRFGANFADTVSGVFIGGAILPSLLKQDPRYFYKGTGSVTSRAVYAIGFSVVCKGDNGRWQPNYSNVLGSLAAGGISNLYYPADDRDGADLTFENAAIGLGATAVSNLLQEFVIKKLTPKVHKHDPATP